MAAPDNKKPKCATTVSHLPNMDTPTYTRGMTHEEARAAWFRYLREVRTLAPTPRVYRNRA